MYPIRTMTRVLKISASGYYAWRSRAVSARATADADLTRRIRTVHAGSHRTYGAPRVHAELKADGLSAGRKRIAGLMRAAGIAGVAFGNRCKDAYNNAMCESFFATLECELIDRRSFRSHGEVRIAPVHQSGATSIQPNDAHACSLRLGFVQKGSWRATRDVQPAKP
jgi:putative transposase